MTKENKDRAISWFQTWGQWCGLFVACAVALLSMGAMRADVETLKSDAIYDRETVKEMLRDLRIENKRDHDRILDLIHELMNGHNSEDK